MADRHRDVIDVEEAASPAALNGPRLEPLAILRDAIRVLGERALRWVVLAMSFTLFAYAVYRPEPWRIAASSIWTLMVHVPIAWKERRR